LLDTYNNCYSNLQPSKLGWRVWRKRC